MSLGLSQADQVFNVIAQKPKYICQSLHKFLHLSCQLSL